MMTKDRLVTAQWVLERNLAWIAAADAKVAIVVALNTAMLGGLAGAFGWADASRTLWAYLLSSASAVLTSGGVFCAAMAMFPRTDGPNKSLLFSKPIAQMSLNEYQVAFKAATDEQLLDDWAGQIHRNAEIAKKKFHWVTLSMRWSFLGLPAWAAAIAVLLNK